MSDTFREWLKAEINNLRPFAESDDCQALTQDVLYAVLTHYDATAAERERLQRIEAAARAISEAYDWTKTYCITCGGDERFYRPVKGEVDAHLIIALREALDDGATATES